MIESKLEIAINSVCPIDGISLGKIEDKSTWEISFSSSATGEQKKAAQSVLDSFDIGAEMMVEKFEEVESAVQAFLDKSAQAHGYDDIRSAISYRGSSNATWAKEADAFFVWRDAVWTSALQVQADVLAGRAQFPTMQEALAMLPVLGI